ncbi:MAG: hypothetical protein MRJ96_05165 [Nitrospirales bacterium]|nr:hypothetical protein [Nitrospira sp.]MDR4500825.1 hypothetical protein [Nitrospirales bacterium]
MKAIGIIFGAMGATLLAVSLACANPALLPKHPGYPAKGKSPATGQATAYDQGQTNASDLQASTMSYDSAIVNDVSDPNRMRVKKSMGAGRLPEVEGPLNKVPINPGGATSTVIQ